MADLLASAMQLHQAGRLGEAETAYRQVLRGMPQSAQAMHFLGMLLCQSNRLDEGLALMRGAVEREPGSVLYRLNLGGILNNAQRYAEALGVLEPAAADGVAVADVLNNFGLALLHTGRVGEALAALRRALILEPRHAAAHYNQGLALQRAGDHERALQEFVTASHLGANPSRAYADAAVSLVRLARWGEAHETLRRAVEIEPGNLDYQVDLANTLVQLNRLDDAAAAYEAILKTHPNEADTLNNLAFLRHKQGRMDEAMKWYQKAAALQPSGNVLANLGAAVMQQGRHAEAIAVLRRAAAATPKYASSLLMALHYSEENSPEAIAAEHLAWGKRMEAEAAQKRNASPAARPPNVSAESGRRLRVGYVSPDFRRHAVGTFLEPLLARHDHEQFEIIGFSNVAQRDGMTDTFRGMCDGWVDIVSFSNARAAEEIGKRRIDILVDLAGHTDGNRLGVFALKPAPIQGTYLGYPNTTGLPTVDFRLSDAVADPPGLTDRFCSEQIVRLDRCFLCYQPPVDPVDVSPLPAAKGRGVTFACFAAFQKMTPQMFELWALILKQVPDSRLLLKRNSLGKGESARESVLGMFARHGVEPGRIELEGGTLDARSHLERYGEVDIMLDTHPYAGTTMTCESLWMGVPVVTVAGEAHVSRVAASILTHAGMGELVATSPEQYVSIAAGLAGDLGALAERRRKAREMLQNSGVMDGAGLARAVEQTYRRLWREWLHK